MNWQVLLQELEFRTSRSAGPGGQHVNKTESRVEVLLAIPGSQGLTDEEKDLIIQKLASRINAEGILSIASQKFKSQGANKDDAITRLQDLLVKSLTVKAKRVKTSPSRQAVENRLQDKKMQAERKANRRKIVP